MILKRIKRLLRRRETEQNFVSEQVNIEYWKSLKQKHHGCRGWVIGNGPSLAIDDLSKLKDEICIASNKIYLAYEHTSWRPTYHTVADWRLIEKIQSELSSFEQITHVPKSSRHRIPGLTAYYWNDLGAISNNPQSNLTFSDDISLGAYAAATITFFNLQLAVYLGLNPIYIIGCDHYYAGEHNVKKDSPIRAGAMNNHFIKGYRKAGELVNPAPIEIMTKGYEHAKVFCEVNNISIFNATRGGVLEVFERKNFESLVIN